MEKEPTSIERIIEALSKLAQAYISLLRHELNAGASHAVAAILSGILVALILSSSLLFFNIALAVVIGSFIGLWLGFLLVAFVYLGIAIWVLMKMGFLRKKIENIIKLFADPK
jgi:hypothetical protein